MNVRYLKSIISLIVAVSIFVLAFYLGGGFSLLIAEKNQDIENPRLSKNLPSYKNQRILPMGNKVTVNNLPVELGYFTTKDDITVVKDELMRKFKDSGLNPHYNAVSEDEGFIQVVDRYTGEIRVFILKRTEDETVVFAGIAPTFSNNLNVKPDTSLGIPADALNYVEVRNEDYGKYARTISFQLKGGKEKNMEMLINRLKELGFSENDVLKNSKVEDVMAFSREGIQLMIVCFDSEGEKGEALTSFVFNVMEKKDE